MNTGMVLGSDVDKEQTNWGWQLSGTSGVDKPFLLESLGQQSP